MARSPLTQRALKVVGAGELQVVDSADVPLIEPDEVLVRVVSMALNPADAKSCSFSPSPGATVGCDFAGQIAIVGDAVKAELAVGDRVCGLAFGNNPLRPGNGAFAEYVAAPGALVFKIPRDMDFDQAATLPCGLATAGLCLHHPRHLGLPIPSQPPATQEAQGQPRHIFIYGGGTATGTLLIQMAARAGLIPVTACSPGRFEWVRSLGAAAAFDYHSPSVGSDIRAYTDNTLTMAIDCLTTTASMSICYEAIGSCGGKYVALDPFPVRTHTRRGVRPSWVLGLTVFGAPIAWKRPFNAVANPKDRAFAEAWFVVAQQMLAEGRIQGHAYETRRGGLEALVDGIDEVRKGRVVGRKLVYRVDG